MINWMKWIFPRMRRHKPASGARALWTAPVLWRFSFLRTNGQGHRTARSKSARGLAQSKTLRFVSASILVGALATASLAAQPAITYPKTRQANQVDDYRGVKVADP